MLAGSLLGACSGVGPGSTGTPDSETTTAPTTESLAPTLSESTAGSSRITVTWSAPATDGSITGYELQWRPSSDTDTDWTVVTDISGTEASYAITGLQPQTTYEVRVRAVFATTAGAWSETITVSTTETLAPTLSESTAGSNRITVTWTAPASDESITGYELQWRPSSGTDWTLVSDIPGTETSYKITGLHPQTTYEVRVRAVFATTAGAWSESISVSTAAPPTLSQTARTGTSITVRWSVPATDESITGYELQLRGASLSSWMTFTGISRTRTRATIENLQRKVTYEVRVRARYGDGAGAWSAIVPCTTGAYVDPPLAGFFSHGTRVMSEAEAAKGFIATPVAAYFYPGKAPMKIRYEVRETGDMLNSTSKGVFEAVPDSEPRSSFLPYPIDTIWGVDDDVDEPDSTVTVQILPGPGYRVGAPSLYTIKITDDD